MPAIGKTANGKIKEFKIIDNYLECCGCDLIELTIPEDVDVVDCSCNYLKELFVPSWVVEVNCSDNKLTKLTLSEGVEFVDCSDNNLSELIIPSSLDDDDIRIGGNKNIKIIRKN